jgi:hypothetical protein
MYLMDLACLLVVMASPFPQFYANIIRTLLRSVCCFQIDKAITSDSVYDQIKGNSHIPSVKYMLKFDIQVTLGCYIFETWACLIRWPDGLAALLDCNSHVWCPGPACKPGQPGAKSSLSPQLPRGHKRVLTSLAAFCCILILRKKSRSP